MATSRLDAVYRSFLITKFFTKGWGQPENLRRLFEFRKTVSNRDECFKLIERDYPVTITKEETSGDCRVVEGHFLTPLERFLPGIVPPEARQAHFQAVIPLKWAQPDYRPMCLHLAGTGDHYFWRRRQLMVKPLIKAAGIGGIILENPFYGRRKPSDQVRSSLHNVSDIFVMGGCLILESLVLLHWCERNNLGPLGVTGLSMGGHMASLAATNWPKPLVLVPCLSWSTASAVFLQGVMSRSINWDLLEDQYLSDGVYREKLSKMVTVIDEAFLAGKKFAKKVSQSVHTSIKEIKNMADQVANKEKCISENTTEKHKINVEMSMKSISNTDNKAPQDNTKNDNVEDSIKNNSQQDFDKFKMELESLSQDGTIRQSLYTKLSSNEKFQLDSRDIEELNELNKENFLSYFMKKYNIVDLQDSKFYSTVSNDKTDPIATNAQTRMLELITEIRNLKQQTKRETQKPDQLDSIGQEFEKINRKFENAVENYTENSKTTARQNFDTATANERAIAENAVKKIDSTQGSKVEKKSRNITEISTDILSGLPFVSKSTGRKIDISKIHWRDREALQFMRGIMDECTHLSNFTVPYDTSLIIAVCAKHDAYVPRDDVGTLEEIWPGAEVRYVDAGHVSAYLLHQSMFRSCIIEAFERSRKKWKDGQHIV